MAPFFQKALLSIAVPFATRWVHQNQKLILKEGRMLLDWEAETIREMGVTDIDNVRILAVPEISVEKAVRFFAPPQTRQDRRPDKNP